MAYDDPNTLEYPNELPDAATYASLPAEGYEPHPLFPLDDNGLDPRDIQFITFRRRRSGDGKYETCPEDIPASELQSWAEVVALWGGGEYKAVAKNRYHRVLASVPQGSEWMVFDTESKPFTHRNPSRSRHSPPVPPASSGTPSPPPTPAPVAPAPASPFELVALVLLREIRERLENLARQSANESAMAGMVKALTVALAPQRQPRRRRQRKETRR
jgi:hypothetical protein